MGRNLQLQIERLSARRPLVSDWFNVDLPCDVDSSGTATPVDALVLINALNTEGARPLHQSKPESQPFFDVSNDEYFSPIDVLMVVNVLNRAAPAVSLAISTSPSDDPNANGNLVMDHVSLLGQTSPYARVTLAGTKLTSDDHQSVWTVETGSEGSFAFQVPLAMGVNKLTLEVRDELGRKKVVDQELRRGDIVTDWNAAVLNVVREWATTSNDPYQGRIVPSRPPEVALHLAMIHAAMFDAINATSGRYEPYDYSGEVIDGASPVAAAAMAAYEVASSFYREADELAVWESTLAESLATIPDDAARARGIELGRSIGANMIALRTGDGSRTPVTYAPGSGPGIWQRTFPDYLPPLLPQWPNVKPFVIPSAAGYRVGPPPELTSAEYAQAVNEVMRLGGLDSAERTADQTDIALFWADGGGTATPPGHWNRIASDVIDEQALSLVDSARTLALLNLAMADAGIVCWDNKYVYNVWRPIDAIRQADLDNNSSTTADANWLPLLRTPPFPSYTSGHSTFSGAAATVLTYLFGEHYAFVSTTDAHSAPGQRPLNESLVSERTFDSFDQAAEEASISRIYGGIHFTFDSSQGLSAGKQVGEQVVLQALKPRVD